MAGENEVSKVYTQEEVDALIAERESGLKANRDEALREAKQAKAALKNYDGVDPEEFKRLKKAAEEAEVRKAAAEGDWKALEKQLIERHQSELTGRELREKKLESALTKRLTSDELRKALTGKAVPEMMELLVEHGAKYVRVRETDEDFEQYVSDEKGNPLVADGQGTPMTVEMFVDQQLRQKFPGAFLGTGSSGGGASKSVGGATGKRTISVSELGQGTNLQDYLEGKVQVA